MRRTSRRVYADEAVESMDLLFEAEDVVELLAEVTGEVVDKIVEDDSVTFVVGEDEFKVETDGTEEVLESCKKASKDEDVRTAARRVATRTNASRMASRTTVARRQAPVRANRTVARSHNATRTIKRISR